MHLCVHLHTLCICAYFCVFVHRLMYLCIVFCIEHQVLQYRYLVVTYVKNRIYVSWKSICIWIEMFLSLCAVSLPYLVSFSCIGRCSTIAPQEWIGKNHKLIHFLKYLKYAKSFYVKKSEIHLIWSYIICFFGVFFLSFTCI